MDERYRSSERLKKRSDFLRVQHTGKRFITPRLVILTTPSSTDSRRFGVTVSTKVGHAVLRNTVKRRLRDIYRKNKPQWPSGVDIVVIARKSAGDVDYETLRADMIAWSNWIPRHLAPRCDS